MSIIDYDEHLKLLHHYEDEAKAARAELRTLTERAERAEKERDGLRAYITATETEKSELRLDLVSMQRLVEGLRAKSAAAEKELAEALERIRLCRATQYREERDAAQAERDDLLAWKHKTRPYPSELIQERDAARKVAEDRDRQREAAHAAYYTAQAEATRLREALGEMLNCGHDEIGHLKRLARAALTPAPAPTYSIPALPVDHEAEAKLERRLREKAAPCIHVWVPQREGSSLKHCNRCGKPKEPTAPPPAKEENWVAQLDALLAKAGMTVYAHLDGCPMKGCTCAEWSKLCRRAVDKARQTGKREGMEAAIAILEKKRGCWKHYMSLCALDNALADLRRAARDV